MPNKYILVIYLISCYLRKFRWSIARWRLIKYAIGKIRTYGHLMGCTRITTCYGFLMELQLHDWVDQHIYVTGDYEEMTAKTIVALLQPGDCCVDAGANIGFFTLLMSKCVGIKGLVWSFEPAPRTRHRLIRNLELNPENQAIVSDKALSNVDGKSMFFDGSQSHSGIASLRQHKDSKTTYEVQTCKLVSCIPKSTRLNLIKIDIEGAEHLALQGMQAILKEQHPDLIIEISEHFLREMGSSADRVYEFLRQFDYQMYIIEWNGLVACQHWPNQNLPVQFNALFTVRKSLPRKLIK